MTETIEVQAEEQVSSYQKFSDLRHGVIQQQRQLEGRLREIDAEEGALQDKLDQAIVLNDGSAGETEGRLQALSSERAGIHRRLQALKRAEEMTTFHDAAQAVLDETGDELRAISAQCEDVIIQLEEAFHVYLRAVSKLKPLEDATSRLQRRREEAYGVLPKGTTHLFVQGAVESNINRQRGPAFMCMDAGRIIRAYQGRMDFDSLRTPKADDLATEAGIGTVQEDPPKIHAPVVRKDRQLGDGAAVNAEIEGQNVQGHGLSNDPPEIFRGTGELKSNIKAPQVRPDAKTNQTHAEEVMEYGD